jgi:glycosyltransferase involved in cell wall biosynthesis
LKIIISVNSAWNLFNFRLGLMKALRASGHEVVAVVPLDRYVERIERLGFRVIPIKIDGKGKNLFIELLVLFQYFRILKRESPNVFLGFTIKPNIYGSLVSKMLCIPVINNIAGLGISFGKKGWLTIVASFLYKHSLRNSLIVFFQNEDDRRLFNELGIIDLKNTQRLPGSGVNLKNFHASADLPCISSQKVHFVLIGRMLWDKGVGEFVDAARVIRSSYPNAVFSLLGFLDVDNPSAISSSQINSWVEEGVINYLGFSDNVSNVILTADCVVLPSYYREGVPRSLLESAAMARPIITTNSVGCRDVVDDGVNGFLCQPRDVLDLVKKIKCFLELSPLDRVKMGKMGRLKVELEFNEKLVFEAYINALDQLT